MTDFRCFAGLAVAALLACRVVWASTEDGAAVDPIEMLRRT